MEVYKLVESEEEVTVLVGVESPEEAGRAAPGVKSCLEFLIWKKRREHVNWTHLEQVQHCTDLPLQVTFPALTEQEKTRPGL